MDLRFSFSFALAALAALAAVAVGCSSATAPVTGTGAPTASSTAPTDPAVDPPADGTPTPTAYTQAEVQGLFDARCVKCHDARSKSLDLSAPFTEATIGVRPGSTAGKTVCGTDGRMTARIVPGDRDASLLWHKVAGTQDCGDRMPYDKGNEPLDAVELERLGLYIDGLK